MFQDIVYEGGLDKGNMSGYGKLILPNGTKYSGGFKDNLFHGKGIIT